ncbi:hypothetical protein KR054_011788 [Drosophila jambulina]|nr:hypothetical protein KR054_011788 [Drosophila jambulina]
MYNVTPHGTTGTPATELMFNRVIRDKIPSINDLIGETVDSEEKDRDLLRKHKGKAAADTTRRAREIDIQVGDKVLLKNVVLAHKLTPTFDTTTYEVTNRKGNVVVTSSGGKSLTRNISHLKKIVNKSPLTSAAVEGQDDGLPIPVIPPQQTQETRELQGFSTAPKIQDEDKVLKLRLQKKEGVWRPVRVESTDEIESDALSHNV